MQILSVSANTHLTKINFIHALPYVLIESSLKKKCKSYNNKLLTVSVAEWSEWYTGKQGVAGSIPGGGIYFHFEFIAYFPSLKAQRSLYK